MDGRRASLGGCYRLLTCPQSEEEEQDWLAGWDSVPISQRGSQPVTGQIDPIG